MKDEALSRYAELIGPRAIVLYRVGGAPAASGDDGLRILVITSRVGIDNPYFYSVRERLPEKLAQCFAQEPFILPAWSLRALQHIDYRPLEIVKGHDIARSYPPAENQSEHVCRLLEAYCDAEVRKVDREYDSSALRDRFGDIDLARARAALQGDATVAGLDRDYAFERSRVVDGYFNDLASMGFPYGALFPQAAYPHAARAVNAKSFVHNVVRNLYQVRRRIEEYVA